RRESLGFLAAPSKDEGIAALEPHHTTTATRVSDEERVDVFLGQAVTLRELAGVDPDRLGGRLVEKRWVDEPIVDDHVGAAQRLEAAHRHESGIARARADQPDVAYAHAAARSRPRSRALASSSRPLGDESSERGIERAAPRVGVGRGPAPAKRASRLAG